LNYTRYYSALKYILAIIVAFSIFAVAGNRYMLSQKPRYNDVESYWVLHDTGAHIKDDSMLWRQGKHVDAGITKSQVDFKLVIPESLNARYVTVSPAYLDTVLVEFFDQQGDTLNTAIMGDKEPHQISAYHYYVGRFLVEIPRGAASARIKVRSTQNMAVSLSFLSREMLVKKSAFSLMAISLLLFIVMIAVIMSLVAGIKWKQPLFFAFAVHHFVFFAALLALRRLLQSHKQW